MRRRERVPLLAQFLDDGRERRRIDLRSARSRCARVMEGRGRTHALVAEPRQDLERRAPEARAEDVGHLLHGCGGRSRELANTSAARAADICACVDSPSSVGAGRPFSAASAALRILITGRTPVIVVLLLVQASGKHGIYRYRW